MAIIPDYRARVGLNPQQTPQVSLNDATSQALQSVGGAVSDVSAAFIQRQDQKDNFRADNDFRKFNLDLEQELLTQANQMQEGGDGFHDRFMTETFRPKREEFLAKVPERLRPRFETMLADGEGADFTAWSTRAATAERDENYRWYKQEITLTHQQMANAIAINPEGYDDYFQAGRALIESAPLPTAEKALLSQQWEEIAQVAHLNALLEKDPQGVLRELGVDARQLSPTTQFEVLSRAVQWQESRDNPSAVSRAGAIGLMQVMPATAVEIAAELKDPNFPSTPDAINEYLSNPYISKMYGEYYLRKQLRAFAGTRNPIETALVAYNAGPGTAQKWVESGYDDTVLPKETRDYKRLIMDDIAAPLARGNPAAVQFTTANGADLGNMQAEIKDRVADAFATIGLEKVKVVSGFRDAERNKSAGGATQSRHMHGDAMDIDVSGMPIAQRIELIKSLSAAGVTGIGVYANTIHADLGGRRAWGPSHGSESIPKWATDVLAQHVGGTTPRPRAISTRYASLPYDKRQAFTSRADQLITAQNSALNRASAVEKVEVKREMDNELATIRATGQPSGRFDESRVSTILGEDDYVQYAYRRDQAQKTFTAVSGINTMTTEDMATRLQDYTPVPGSSDFAAQQEIEAAVQREVDRVTRLRAKSPALGAMEFPEVAAAYQQLQQTMLQGDPAPSDVQSFVRLMMEKQADFDTPPEARAPIPDDWAVEIGRSLTRVPETQGRNLAEVRAAIQAQYNGLKAYFGDYTDEVIVHAVSEYTGLSKPTADLITGYMTAIQAGGDPFRTRQLDSAVDNSQMDAFNWQRSILSPIPGAAEWLDQFRPDATTAPTEETGLTPEQQLRRLEQEAMGQ